MMHKCLLKFTAAKRSVMHSVVQVESIGIALISFEFSKVGLLSITDKSILWLDGARAELSLQPERCFAVHALRHAMHHRLALHQAEQSTRALFRFSRLAANKRPSERSASSGAIRHSELFEGPSHRHSYFSFIVYLPLGWFSWSNRAFFTADYTHYLALQLAFTAPLLQIYVMYLCGFSQYIYAEREGLL